ncbi:MAG: amino acid ABC transporter permease [Streptococcaceae bacterium]|nr:amino acid ABC transporter permease [Streptococcaceae bacterium]
MSYILQILPELWQGFGTTLEVFVVSLVISIPLGMLVAFLLRVPVLKWFLNIYIWIMRGTPLLLQIIIAYFGLLAAGIPIFSRVSACIFAITINYAAYFAEIFRGGIAAVPKGQTEAAEVLKLSKWQTARLVIIPQVIRIVIPSVMNEVLNLVKDTAMVYVVGAQDIMQNAFTAMQRDINMTPLVIAGIFYLILTALLTFASRGVERHLSVERRA